MMSLFVVGCLVLLTLVCSAIWLITREQGNNHRMVGNHKQINREYLKRKQRESGAVAAKSSTTDTTKVIKPRKGVGYPKDNK